MDKVSQMFKLSGSNRLLNDYLPTGFSGNYNVKSPIVILGINPGFSKNRDRAEENKRRTDSWKSYLNFHLGFYQFFKEMKFESHYYTMLWHLFCGLGNGVEESDNKWDFFNKNVFNANLIPYHSVKTRIPSDLSDEQKTYLDDRFSKVTEFALNSNPRLIIFNGSPWHTLLIGQKKIDKFYRKKITSKFSLYLFEYCDTPAVLFDKFFSAPFWGITKIDRTNIIPQIIAKKYPKSSFQK